MNPEDLVAQAHRRHWPEVLAATVRLTRDLDLAEDCVQEAYARALRAWRDQVPSNSAAWLTTTARNAALDQQRRARTLRRKLPLLLVEDDDRRPTETDQLRLVMTACHPVLSTDAQVPLTLRLVCGLTVPEIAAGLLLRPSTVAARITRAKAKIAGAGVSFRVPDDDQLPGRLDTVLTVVNLVLTAGHLPPQGDGAARPDLIERALDLATLLVRRLPESSEAQGMLASCLFTAARERARGSGELLLLENQDRDRWNPALTRAGLRAATRALNGGTGPFALQAGIVGLHMQAESWEATDWAAIVRLYDGLAAAWPTPVVELNRWAARSMVPGADLASVLAGLDGLANAPPLAGYVYLPAIRADVLRRLGRTDAARDAYEQAVRLTGNVAEQGYLRRRLASLP